MLLLLFVFIFHNCPSGIYVSLLLESNYINYLVQNRAWGLVLIFTRQYLRAQVPTHRLALQTYASCDSHELLVLIVRLSKPLPIISTLI